MVSPAKKCSVTSWARTGSRSASRVTRLIEGEQIVVGRQDDGTRFIQVDAFPAAAVPDALFATGLLDENAAHGKGGGGEEVAAAVPVPLFPRADQAQVRLVDQGGGLERLARLLPCHPLGREPAQLVVDQRQELRRGTSVALPDGVQDAGHLIHRTFRSMGVSQRKKPRRAPSGNPGIHPVRSRLTCTSFQADAAPKESVSQ